MDINIMPLASAAAQRNAFNAAFYELGLRWHWDEECYVCALCEEDQRAYLRRYVQDEQAHMLRVYDVDFLANLQGITFISRQLIQFTTRNNAFRFGANADEDLTGTNAGNYAGANLAGLGQINIKFLLV